MQSFITTNLGTAAAKCSFRTLTLSVALLFAFPSFANDKEYGVLYSVKLLPQDGYAEVSIKIDDASQLSLLSFSLDPELHSDVQANGRLALGNTSAEWTPPEKRAELTLRAKINHLRSNEHYDALMTDDWAIFRGDDIVPTARVKAKVGASSVSHLEFEMPDDWTSVNTGWARDLQATPVNGAQNAYRFIIDNPERNFDRPTGWMIAGKASTRRALTGDTWISVSAPNGTHFHRMDVLTFLNFVWPHMEQAFGQGPDKLLIVGGDDPMWRGGLSASNSLFLHSDRPLVSENGTSTLLHEVVHMYTRISGGENDDWIAEGLAEFYAIELLYRAGGINDSRKRSTYEELRDWSGDVGQLRQTQSTGATTAKAALVFAELHQEIKDETNNDLNLDDLTRELMKEREISFQEISETCAALIGRSCKALESVGAQLQSDF